MHTTKKLRASGQSRPAARSGNSPVCEWLCLAALLVACAGCNSGGSDSGDQASQLPFLNFWLRASAAGEVDGFSVECGLDYIVDLAGEVSRSDDVVEYVGTMGGEARRSLLRADGSGMAIFANAFSEVQVLLLLPDRVQINLINVPPDPDGVGSRFWDVQRRIEGRLMGDRIFGEWVCAPLDTEVNGINDDTIVMPGTWMSEPIDG